MKGVRNTDLDRICLAAAGGDAREVACVMDRYEDKENIFALTTSVDTGRTMLHRAAMKGHVELMKVLLDQGETVDRKDTQGATPLHMAAFCGQTEAVQFLMSRGADKDAPDALGWTPLAAAARKGQRETVEFLIARDADVNARSSLGMSVVYSALSYPEILKLLANNGADVDAADEGGWTPLMWTCAWKDLPDKQATLETLFGLGARLDLKAKDGRTLSAIAREFGADDVIPLIERKEAEREANMLRLQEDMVVRTLRLKLRSPGT